MASGGHFMQLGQSGALTKDGGTDYHPPADTANITRRTRARWQKKSPVVNDEQDLRQAKPEEQWIHGRNEDQQRGKEELNEISDRKETETETKRASAENYANFLGWVKNHAGVYERRVRRLSNSSRLRPQGSDDYSTITTKRPTNYRHSSAFELFGNNSRGDTHVEVVKEEEERCEEKYEKLPSFRNSWTPQPLPPPPPQTPTRRPLWRSVSTRQLGNGASTTTTVAAEHHQHSPLRGGVCGSRVSEIREKLRRSTEVLSPFPRESGTASPFRSPYKENQFRHSAAASGSVVDLLQHRRQQISRTNDPLSQNGPTTTSNKEDEQSAEFVVFRRKPRPLSWAPPPLPVGHDDDDDHHVIFDHWTLTTPSYRRVPPLIIGGGRRRGSLASVNENEQQASRENFKRIRRSCILALAEFRASVDNLLMEMTKESQIDCDDVEHEEECTSSAVRVLIDMMEEISGQLRSTLIQQQRV